MILYHVARVQTCLGEADPVKNLFVVKQFSGAFLFHKQHVSTLWEDIHPAEWMNKWNAQGCVLGSFIQRYLRGIRNKEFYFN